MERSQRHLAQSAQASPWAAGRRRQYSTRSAPSPDRKRRYDPNVQSNGGSALPQGVQGVMTDQGFVPTRSGRRPQRATKTRRISRRARFWRFRRFRRRTRQQRLGQSNSPQYGRGLNGGYSNLLRLQSNVFVTPSPGGDSIIVTTLPQNYDAVRQIIEALDIVPRQVMIEVIMAEVTLSSDQKLGFSLGGNFLELFNRPNTGQVQVNARAGAMRTPSTRRRRARSLCSTARITARCSRR